jgi:spoIIIJ-associated protein
MKDLVFSGPDLTQAVAAAARAVGLDADELRYVVLEEGLPAGRGRPAVSARIAVLLEGSAPVPAAAPAQSETEAAQPDPQDLLRRVVQAAGLDVETAWRETGDALEVEIGGPDEGFFAEEDGAVAEALEHLLQKAAAEEGSPRLRLRLSARRRQREEALRRQVMDLVAAVRSDGQPRALPPLNSYERRQVHILVAELPDLASFSVGEGSDRRVTLARREPPGDADPR